MKLFRLFRSKSAETEHLRDKYKDCDVEFMPNSQRFYPRYKGRYLYYWQSRGNFTIEELISGCIYADTEKEAILIIDKFLELRGVGSVIIKLTANNI